MFRSILRRTGAGGFYRLSGLTEKAPDRRSFSQAQHGPAARALNGGPTTMTFPVPEAVAVVMHRPLMEA